MEADGQRETADEDFDAGRRTLCLRCLFDTWMAPDGRKLHTCTIITTRPNEVVADIHDRMPVILRREDEDLWLDREKFDPDLLQLLLVPFDPGQMRVYPVSTIVGNPKNDFPECIEEIAWQ